MEGMRVLGVPGAATANGRVSWIGGKRFWRDGRRGRDAQEVW